MGLDITAYKNLTIAENPILDEDGYPIDYEKYVKFGESMKWSEKHFPGRGEGLSPDTVYECESTHGFRAGSYFGYGRWRELLDSFAIGDDFQELINFADNEGVIGCVVAKKLLNDFVKNHRKAFEYSKTITDGDYWFAKYNDWLKAFRLASDNGAVEFH